MTPTHNSSTSNIDKPLRSRRFVAAVVAAGVLGGGAIGLTVTLPSAAGAAHDGPTEKTAVAPNGDETRDEDRGGECRGKRDGSHHRGKRDAAGFAAVAESLSLEVETLAAELRSGKSIAEVAEAQGVDVATVAGVMADAAEARLDAAVESGRLTDAEAAEKRARIAERVEQRINKVREAGEGRGEGPGGPRGQPERPSAASPDA